MITLERVEQLELWLLRQDWIRGSNPYIYDLLAILAEYADRLRAGGSSVESSHIGGSAKHTEGGSCASPSPGSITAEGYNPALSGQGLISREDEAALAEINKGLSYEENFRDYDAEEKALAHIKALLAALPDAPKEDK